MRTVALLLVAALSVGVADSSPRPQLLQGEDVFVTVETGALRGVVATSLNGTLYNRFVGIPFATPPLGDLRFRAPQPAANWSGTRDALTYGSECPQGGAGSEDCLYVNVYVPVVNDSSPLAVMVNIYGGAYTGGSSTNRAPDYFMDKGVLLVTFNYRVGSIGFLSLQNDDIPGNAGLKDQVFALQWVQRNIAAFGGDPSKVTIFGESAGGSSTSHLFFSPAAKGLFRGVIMESGEANAVWGVEANPREKAYRLAAALGFQTQDANDSAVAAFLRAANHSDLTRDDNRALSDFEKRHLSRLAFVPVIEPHSDTAVVTESPGDILRDGRYNQVAVMTGVTSADGGVVILSSGILWNDAYAADVRENFTELVGSQLQLPTVEEQTDAAVKLENFYFGDEGFSIDNTQAVYDMVSDMYFIQPAEALARTVANTSDLPVYLYYFDYDGYGATQYGMGHAAEASYLFLQNGPDKDPNSNDGKVTELLTTLWTNFAKYGDPAPNGSPVTWNPFTADTANYLDMKLEFVTRQDLLKERMDFWKQILHQ
ncbi:juvenile hormone esterase-like isoform X2 [Schistocerca nitens]|uniref:juvenile hormone esterase-like isoform X2 n=1 Tax=Schistocerca nitens TaxID=7011 RepID=UPI002118FD0D|nr:juvenile hormone esterase-like isoform X2 [Schistocerca nitens]